MNVNCICQCDFIKVGGVDFGKMSLFKFYVRIVLGGNGGLI